jgi:hypothetical protein
MAERTAWDNERGWHDHWVRVAALLADNAATRSWPPTPDIAAPADTCTLVAPRQQIMRLARDGSLQPGRQSPGLSLG